MVRARGKSSSTDGRETITWEEECDVLKELEYFAELLDSGKGAPQKTFAVLPVFKPRSRPTGIPSTSDLPAVTDLAGSLHKTHFMLLTYTKVKKHHEYNACWRNAVNLFAGDYHDRFHVFFLGSSS